MMVTIPRLSVVQMNPAKSTQRSHLLTLLPHGLLTAEASSASKSWAIKLDTYIHTFAAIDRHHFHKHS